jgi:4-amino-4-deoxy-L-arabinose transferase-like glycosyltransferase
MQMTGRWRLRGAPLDRVFLPAILGVCVGLRIAWILRYDIDPRTLQADAIWYVFHAALLAAGGEFVDQFGNPTAAYPPGYPAMIAAAYAVFGEHDRIHQLLNVALSALSCLFVFLFARRALGRTTAWLAATLLALCPGDVFQAGVGLSGLAFQSLFMASLLVFLLLDGARREPSGFGWAGYGALLGAASLVRGASLLFLPVAVVAHRISTGSWRAALRMALFSGLGFTVLVGPWLLRNALVMDAPLLFASDGARALLIAHAPFSTGRNEGHLTTEFIRNRFAHIQELPPHRQEVEAARAETRFAIRWALTHPLEELSLIPRRLYWLYAGDHSGLVYYEKAYRDDPKTGKKVPGTAHTRWYRTWAWVADSYFQVLLLLALAGFTRTLSPRARRTAIVPLTFLYFNFLHGVLFAGTPRFHAAFLPLVVILAAVGIEGRRRPWRLEDRTPG